MKQADQKDVMKRLDVFTGEWTMEAAFQGAPPAGQRGHAVFEWVLGGQYLLERSEIPGAPDSIAIVSTAPEKESYTQHYFDSRGVVRVYAMTFSEGVWTLLRGSSDFTPLDFWQRFRATFSEDGNTINGAWENSEDGVHWEHDFDLTYTKLKPKRHGGARQSNRKTSPTKLS